MAAAAVDRAALLALAAKLLEVRPFVKRYFTADGVRYITWFEWPGVVRVFNYNEGGEAARSMPGRPLVPHAEPGQVVRLVADKVAS